MEAKTSISFTKLLTYVSCSVVVILCGFGGNFAWSGFSVVIGSVATGSIRSAFEYGGQKCSACSRLYVPDSIWPKVG